MVFTTGAIMKKLKGWRTIALALVMFLVGGLDSIQGQFEVPQWVYGNVYPALMLFMRYMTTTPIMQNQDLNTVTFQKME